MPFFGTTPFAAPGLGIIAAIIMLGFGLWWLARAEAVARRRGEGYGDALVAPDTAAEDTLVRERATTAGAFDPPEVHRGHHSESGPSILVAILPLIVVILVNLAMSMWCCRVLTRASGRSAVGAFRFRRSAGSGR